MTVEGNLIQGKFDQGEPTLDIQHAMMVRADPQRIYKALTEGEELSAWFGPECAGEPRVGSMVDIRFHDRHGYSLQFEVAGLEPGSRVVWRVVQAIPGWDDFPSTLTWTLHPYESSTIVHLRHSGWPEGHEAYPSLPQRELQVGRVHDGAADLLAHRREEIVRIGHGPAA